MPIIATQAKGVNPTQLEQEIENADAGVLKSLPTTASLTMEGVSLTQAQIDSRLKSYLSLLQAVDTAKRQHQAALVARDQGIVEARNFFLQLKKAVIVYFGAQSAQLADFGFEPAKAKAERTSGDKALQAAKAKLTREARGTTSRKQKAAINPGVASPAVLISPDGTMQAIPPKVADGQLPAVAGESGSPSADAE